MPETTETPPLTDSHHLSGSSGLVCIVRKVTGEQEDKSQSISLFRGSACIMFADISLTKLSLNDSPEAVWGYSTKDYGWEIITFGFCFLVIIYTTELWHWSEPTLVWRKGQLFLDVSLGVSFLNSFAQSGYLFLQLTVVPYGPAETLDWCNICPILPTRCTWQIISSGIFYSFSFFVDSPNQAGPTIKTIS